MFSYHVNASAQGHCAVCEGSLHLALCFKIRVFTQRDSMGITLPPSKICDLIPEKKRLTGEE